MSELWTDERIIAVSEGLGAHFDRDSGDRLLWNQMARMIEKDMREMRDDLQERIEELERMVSLEMTQATTIAELRHALRRRIAENASLRAMLAKELKDEDVINLILEANDALLKGVAEIQRLKAQLPGPEVLKAIQDMTEDAAQTDYYDGYAPNTAAVESWLDSIEAEKEAGE